MPPHPAGFTRIMWGFQTPVEQQTPGGETQPNHDLWIINPTLREQGEAAIWDADDTVRFAASGVWEPGQSASISQRVFADWCGHGAAIRVSTSRGSPRLRASIEVVGLLHLETAGLAAVIGPGYDRVSPDLAPVEGSNGGLAMPYVIRFTAWNPTERRIRTDLAEATVTFTNSDFTDAYGLPSAYSEGWHEVGTYPGPRLWWWTQEGD